MGEQAVNVDEGKTRDVAAVDGPMAMDRVEDLKGGTPEPVGVGRNAQPSLATAADADAAGLQLLCSAHPISLAGKLNFAITGCEVDQLSLEPEQAAMARAIGCSQDLCGACVWRREAASARCLNVEYSLGTFALVGGEAMELGAVTDWRQEASELGRNRSTPRPRLGERGGHG